MRFRQRPPPAGLRLLARPAIWCARCFTNRSAWQVHGSKRRVYACPRSCDDYAPRLGRIDGLHCSRCGRTRDVLQLVEQDRRVFACARRCDDEDVAAIVAHRSTVGFAADLELRTGEPGSAKEVPET